MIGRPVSRLLAVQLKPRKVSHPCFAAHAGGLVTEIVIQPQAEDLVVEVCGRGASTANNFLSRNGGQSVRGRRTPRLIRHTLDSPLSGTNIGVSKILTTHIHDHQKRADRVRRSRSAGAYAHLGLRFSDSLKRTDLSLPVSRGASLAASLTGLPWLCFLAAGQRLPEGSVGAGG
jgi:hypothetical protein